MFTRTHPVLTSWAVVGLTLAFVIGAQAYQKTHDPLTDGPRVAALLGRSWQAPTSRTFRVGEVTAIMGRAELDLRETAMASDGEMTLQILALMGNVVVRVPESWRVDARALPVAGAVRDRRLRSSNTGEAFAGGESGSPRLVLRGVLLMGSITIAS